MRPLTAEEEDSPLMDLREHRESAISSNKHALMDLKLYLETPVEGGLISFFELMSSSDKPHSRRLWDHLKRLLGCSAVLSQVSVWGAGAWNLSANTGFPAFADRSLFVDEVCWGRVFKKHAVLNLTPYLDMRMEGGLTCVL